MKATYSNLFDTLFSPASWRSRQVSVVYYRAGYGPEDYPTEVHFEKVKEIGKLDQFVNKQKETD